MIDDKDLELFRGSISGAKKIKQDTVQFKKNVSSSKDFSPSVQVKQQQSKFYFSDEYIPDIDTYGTVKYVRQGADKYLAKQLRRGDFPPELMLDLHGLNKDAAKKELALQLIKTLKEPYDAIKKIMEDMKNELGQLSRGKMNELRRMTKPPLLIKKTLELGK